MNTTAIHHAIRLQKHPEEMAWLCYADADLPDGTTDLLRIYANKKQLSLFAKKHEIEEQALSQSLFNFIDQVVVNKNNNDEKVLGTDRFSNLQLQHFHYELLQNIYLEDSADLKGTDVKRKLIHEAYQRLEEKKREQDSIRFSEHRKSPTVIHKSKKTAPQASYFKTIAAAVSAISIFALVALAGKFNHTDSLNTAISPIDTPDTQKDAQKVLIVATANSTINNAQAAIEAPRPALQNLIKRLEMAYEKGNVQAIAPILANTLALENQNPKQLRKKLETLFEITAERKMVLYDFTWKPVSNTLEGQGKFLSRYQLVGEKDWLTRTGNALITAKIIDDKLRITELGLENPID